MRALFCKKCLVFTSDNLDNRQCPRCESHDITFPEKKILTTSFNDMNAIATQPNRWLVQNLIPESSITILAAKRANFKTFTSLEIALALAQARPCFQQFPCQQASTLFIDEENGLPLLKERLLLMGMQLTEGLPIDFASMEAFKLDDELQTEKLREFLKDRPDVKLIVVDSLRRVTNGDENDAATISALFHEARRLTAELGVAWLFIHHMRKGNAENKEDDALDTVRGSSDIVNSADVVLLSRRKGTENLVTISQLKNRLAVELEPFNVAVNELDGVITLQCIGAAAAELNEMQKAVHELAAWLFDQPASKSDYSAKELKANLEGFSSRTIERTVSQCVTERILQRVTRGVYQRNFTVIEKFLGISANRQPANTARGTIGGMAEGGERLTAKPPILYRVGGIGGNSPSGGSNPIAVTVEALVTIPAHMVPSLGGSSIPKGALAEISEVNAAFVVSKGFVRFVTQ